MMNTLVKLAVLCGVISISAGLQAQARSVIGGDGKARECYLNATLVADGNTATRRMLEPCSYALDYSTLASGDRAATFTNRGVLQVALGNFDEALSDYAASMSLIPEAGENYINRGNVHYQMGDYTTAIADYTMAVQLGIDQMHIAYFDRGLALEKSGDLAGAEADYRMSLTIMPDWSLAHTRLDSLLAGKIEAPSNTPSEVP